MQAQFFRDLQIHKPKNIPEKFSYWFLRLHFLTLRAQASSHNSQGVVDGGVDEAGVSTAEPDRSAVLCSRMGQGGCSQRCCSSAPTGASKPPQECDA